MSIRQLRIFLAVADTGSFAAAAERLGLTHSAVSVQIRNLEQDFGVSLFDRSRKPPQLSDKGQSLLAPARDVVARYDALATEVRDSDALTGEFRLGSVGSVLTGLLPQILAALRREFPDLHVSLESGFTGDLVRLVRDGELDAAIVSDFGSAGSDLICRPILEEQLVFVVPVDAPDEPVSALIRRYPFIRYAPDASVGRVIDAAIRAAKLRVNEQMRIDWIEAIEAMVSDGLGVSVIPKRSSVNRGQRPLRELSFGPEPRFRTLSLVERKINPRTQLADMLLQRMKAAGNR